MHSDDAPDELTASLNANPNSGVGANGNCGCRRQLTRWLEVQRCRPKYYFTLRRKEKYHPVGWKRHRGEEKYSRSFIGLSYGIHTMIEIMKRARICFVIVVAGFVFCLLGTETGVFAGRAQIAANGVVIQVVTITKQDAATIFGRVHAVLLKETKVPVRWPSFLPAETSDEHPLYVNLLSEGADNYDMELGWTPDCIGGGYCHYGTVRASINPMAEPRRAQAPVKLRDGIVGYFMESSTCGSRCDDAMIGWAEGGYHFSISVKAETKETLIKVADSAIASGHVAGRDTKKPETGTFVP
jgi:hypothetical protein